MLKYIRIFIVVLVLSCLSVNADTTYIRGNVSKGTSEVAVRSCASKSCSVVKNDLNKGIYLSYPETFEILGEENDFYNIRFQYNGFWYTGFIAKGSSSKVYVEKTEYIITDAVKNELLTLGFPLKYAEKLAILKTIHPAWIFTPLQVNATWDEVIAGETKYISTNLIDGANTSLRNTEDGAYVNGVWSEFAGGGWYSASKQVVKYFVDPRNFLNENHVFMFEILSFDPLTQTEEAIQSLLNGTFMSGNAFYYNELNEKIEISYAKTFVDSGSTNGVSSIHLVSRVILEQGVNGSALSSGDDAEYPGYYNFFNINANGDTTADVIHNGLAYAQKQGWNSPYNAILGGGKLFNKYVSYGQNTLYLQKFDFAGDTYYTNQYMQNIRAPYQESYTTYKTYVKNNFLDSGFKFSIPVFNGVMPDETSLSEDYNEDATLSSLSITGCNLMPSFTSSAYNYSCNVDDSTSKVTINAVPTQISSSVTGNGDIDLNGDVTETNVIVTAASGATNTYKIVINKLSVSVLSPDEILSKLQINNHGGYISGFDLGSDAASLNQLININYPAAVPVISNNGKLVTGLTLKLTSGTESNYTILIYGDNNGDGEIDIIDLLKTQKHILNVNQLQDSYLKASDVNKDGVVDIIDLLKIQKHILNVSKIEQ